MSPYKEHPVFEKLENPQAKIWRYMDIPKYVSLLDKRALYFSRADVLAEKFDPFEGKYPNEIVMKLLEHTSSENERKHLFRVIENPEFQKMLVINCWHINEVESYHMWKIYATRDYGVAIQSTFERLCNCFEVYKNNDVFIGRVSYDQNKIIFGNSFYPYMHKRPYFESDKELRAIILNIWGDYEKRIYDDSYLSHKGSHIPIDLDALIEKVVVIPGTPKNEYEKIKSVSKKYGMKKLIERSKIDDKPISNLEISRARKL